jgi:DNA-binding PadR family transcriptional regulator
MSDAYAAPSGWTAGSANRAHRGPHQNDNHPTETRQERRAEREARHQERRASWRAAMALKAAMVDDGGEQPEDGRRGRRGGGRGRGRFGPPGMGGPGFDGPRGRRGGRGRARRGDVRAAILTLLAEEARNGYGVIQEIEERSNGVWKPSPGAVYPALQQLEDEGLVRPVEVDGRKLFELTDAGRTHVEATLADAPPPWAAVAEEAGTSYRDAKHQLAQVWHAYAAVAQDGNPDQIAAASKVLADARRSLYRILAEDDESTT